MILVGDVTEKLRELPDESVQCVVTSPPYWGLRDYGVVGQLGLEATPTEYVERMVAVFAGVRRVLRRDGALWLNMGDSYASAGGHDRSGTTSQRVGRASLKQQNRGSYNFVVDGLKPKDLVGMPWRLAFALQADGWYLRSDIIWSKPNPMPESVTDRPTKSHEYLFLLAKSERYYYDAVAIREPYQYGRDHHRNVDNPPLSAVPGAPRHTGLRRSGNKARVLAEESAGRSRLNTHLGTGVPWEEGPDGRNARTVWTIPTTPYPETHFATFPEALVEPCIKAGTKPGDVVLDPFAGSGTTLAVAKRLDRDYIGIELNPKYAALAERRLERSARQIALEGIA